MVHSADHCIMQCIGCGQCCRIAKIFWGDMPWPIGYKGMACAALGEDNRCTIYAERPAVCRSSTARAAGLSEEEIALQQPCPIHKPL